MVGYTTDLLVCAVCKPAPICVSHVIAATPSKHFKPPPDTSVLYLGLCNVLRSCYAMTFGLQSRIILSHSTIKSKLIYDCEFDFDVSKRYSKLSPSNSFELKKGIWWIDAVVTPTKAGQKKGLDGFCRPVTESRRPPSPAWPRWSQLLLSGQFYSSTPLFQKPLTE